MVYVLHGHGTGRLKSGLRDKLQVARMQKAAARMQTLINDLLAFSRVIRGSQPFVPVNLGTVTREVLGDLEVRIEKSALHIKYVPKKGLVPTVGDRPATQIGRGD